MRGRGALLWIVALLAVAAPAAAQDAYPNRPIRWVVPFPAGGPTDTLSRILAAKLGDVWKSGIVIENKGGAAGAIGTDFAAKSAPDGYTIMLGTQSTNASNKIFYPNLPYDPITDFEPLTLLGTACMVLVIPTSIPVNNAKELVEWIKKQEAPAAYAAVTGSSQHIAAELLAKRAGLKATLVPYRGSAQAQPDLIAGRIVYMFDNLPSALPQARAGKVKALAQTCATRSPSAPELPTMVEAGFADLDAQGDRRQAVGRHQQGAEGSRLAREMEGAGIRSDRQHAGGVCQASERRPGVLESDDRIHRRQGGVGARWRMT
ncbi:MAG: tripartite tricarboxylate transporter substrate binding protein [Alphaproteobacteria bacterium]|nr:tripartite tricarboxylate transporter substrate binding protein [Alphaproteobacteria bacterium]